jgi:segregation and condensation protein A
MTSPGDSASPGGAIDDWESAGDAPRPDEILRIDVEGFEGPLDLLLALARTHKLDLTRISVLALAEQYLAYIAAARALRIELAADYLVMAAWLAFLKSKLLLPKTEVEDDEPSGEELAAQLAFRLQRLGAMRDAAAKLATRKRLGRDVFGRGMPEGVRTIRANAWDAEVYDLLSAYAQQRQKDIATRVTVRARPVWSLKDARGRIERLLGHGADWAAIDAMVRTFLDTQEHRRTAIASTFGASLEMARGGNIELRQHAAFAPLYMRRRIHVAAAGPGGTPA